MDIQNLCPKCMREVKDPAVKFCPNCGKNLTQKEKIQHQLKPFSMLKNKYLVGEVLGQGGFGITYIGFDTMLEVRVAIKELYPRDFCTRESATTNMVTIYDHENRETVMKWQERFLSEARRLGRCSGLPGVVDVRDFFLENNTAYMVLEYLEGMDLGEYAKRQGGKIPADILLSKIEPVIVALGEVHKQGLIHRDISPDNIRCLHTGQMKLMDFGAARDYASNDEKSLSIMLKRGYAPEEQYRSKGKQGPWTDVYALAATLYKCMTGVTPPEAMDRTRDDELKRPNDLGVGIPVYAENAILKAMAVYAEDRFQSMEEFHSALYGKTNAGQAAERVNTAFVPETDRQVRPTPQYRESVVTKSERKTQNDDRKAPSKKSSSTGKIILGVLCFILCACVGAGGFVLLKSNIKNRAEKTLSDDESKKAPDEDGSTESEETAADESTETEEAASDGNIISGFEVQELDDGTVAIIGYQESEKELVIPEKLGDKMVTVLKKLETDEVKQLTISGSVVAIGEDAVVSNSIKKIILRDGIEKLNDGAFAGCEKLEEVNIPKTIDYIGTSVFPKEFIEKQSESRGIYYVDGIALAIKEDQTEFKWGNNTRGIAGDFWKIFHGSQEIEMDSLQIPDDVVFIGKGAFRCVHANEIHVPETVRKVGKYALGCNADKEPYGDVTIYGAAGSAAEEYASECGIRYETE